MAINANVSQSGQEIVGADVNPPVNVSQAGQEIVGADANPPVNVAQSFQEIVQSTVVVGAAPPTFDTGAQARRYAQFFVPKAPWPRLQNKQAELRALVPGFDPGRLARNFWQHFIAPPFFARNTKVILGPPPPPYIPTTDPGRQMRRWIHYFYKAPPVTQRDKLRQHASVAPPPITALVVDALVTKNLISDTTAGPLNVASLVRKALSTDGGTTGFQVGALVTKRLVSIAVVTGFQVDALVRKALCLAIPAVAQTAPFVYSASFGAIPVFPALPESYPVKVSPGLDTIVGTTKSLREMRFAQRTYPLWDIEIPFEELRDQTQNQVPYAPFAGFEQYQTLVQTWMMMYGQSGVFAFNCPWDNSRTNQTIGTGDGETWTFAIYSTWGLGAQAQTLPVGYVNAISDVYVNGVLVPTTKWTFSRNKLYFIGANGMIYPPAAGATISLTFSYYYLCRFTEDEQDFEEFAKNRWVVQSLKFRAVLWL